MLCAFALSSAFAQTTAAAVTWQSASGYQPQPAFSFTTPAPNVYDGSPGDTGTGYSGGSNGQSVYVLWDLGHTVSLSGFEAAFVSDYQCYAAGSSDGVTWTDLNASQTSGSTVSFAPVSVRYVQFVVMGSIALSFTDTRLYDGSGALISASPTIPAAPTGFSATGGVGQATLSWNAVPGAASYNVYRGTSAGAETLLQSGITTTSFTDTSAVSGTTYFYNVTAVSAAGESVAAGETSVYVFAATHPGTYVWTQTDPITHVTTQSPVYSGGTGGTFTPGGNGYTGTISGGGNYPAAPISLTLTGSLTATFNWNNEGDPNSLPPSSVILTQSVTGSWQLNGANTYVGTIDTNLGQTHTSYDNYGDSLSGIGYQVRNKPGQSFSITPPVNPTVNASTGENVQCGGATVSLTYSAVDSPLTIDLHQSVLLDPADDSWKVLTGQQITASLSGLPFTPGAGSTYQWSVTTQNPNRRLPDPADVFKTYNENATSNQLVLLSNADVTGRSTV